MRLALRQAGLAPGDVQHLNAHSTSTPVGDSGELAAIKTVFGSDRRIAVSATKSATGHLLGAAGGLEAILTTLALRDQIAPPTLNLEHPDPRADGIDLVGGEARTMPMTHFMRVLLPLPLVPSSTTVSAGAALIDTSSITRTAP